MSPLEKRQLLAIVVTTAADSGPGSLRQAILDANAHIGPDEIDFNIPGSGAVTISLSSVLPAITDTVTLDATTQPGYSGTPLIKISGTSTGAGAIGIDIEDAPNVSVSGLSIFGFSNAAIVVSGTGAAAASITGNFIGLLEDGASVVGNGTGIFINTPAVTIGGATAGSRNVISGNTNGIQVSSSADGAWIQGNYVGTDATGTLDRGNTGGGIVLNGRYAAVLDNVVSGNDSDGIHVDGASYNVVVHNMIGTDVTGSVALANSGYGASLVNRATGNTIGGSSTGQGNTITGNTAGQVSIDSSGNAIMGNLIGLTTGGVGISGQGYGIQVGHGANNQIGGTREAGGNTIGAGLLLNSGNTGSVAWYQAEGNANDSYLGNDGASLGITYGPGRNRGRAFQLDGGTGEVLIPNSAIGPLDVTGTALSAEAWINPTDFSQSNNPYDGQMILSKWYDSQGADGYTLTLDNGHLTFQTATTDHANFFLQAPAAVALNVWSHVAVTYDGATATLYVNGVVVASAALTGNILHNENSLVIGNANNGTNYGFKGLIDDVAIYNRTLDATEIATLASADPQAGANIRGVNRVQGNFITGALGTVIEGIGIDASSNILIGGINGPSQTFGNIVSGNNGDGIDIFSVLSSNILIQGNWIGTDAAGTAADGNLGEAGIYSQGTQVTIGGSLPGAGNVISGNAGEGIMIASGSQALIQGNKIGTDAAGSLAIGNGRNGILNYGTATIGGSAAGEGNTISGNAYHGIDVENTPSVTILGNFLGTDGTGNNAIGNGYFGINVGGPLANGIVIGGSDADEGNLIGGNTRGGILIDKSTAASILGNRIGISEDGTHAVPNGVGVFLAGALGTSIGGSAAGAGNTIGGNTGDGIYIEGNSQYLNGVGTQEYNDGDVVDQAAFFATQDGEPNSSPSQIIYNHGDTIALDFFGLTPPVSGSATLTISLWNLRTGGAQIVDYRVNGSSRSTSAFATSNGPNAITIYTLPVDLADLVDGSLHVKLELDTTVNPVGVDYALLTQESTADVTVILGNRIGNLDNIAFANGGNGISNESVGSVTIGGANAGEGNLISGNANNGILISHGNGYIQGNTIGLRADGLTVLGNGLAGIEVDCDGHATIGGDTPDARNIISGNTGAGIGLLGTSGALIVGNFIGTDASGQIARGNQGGGVHASQGASNNTIGGGGAGSGNLISGNAGEGITISDLGTSANVIQGNRIGTDASGTVAVANGSDGIGIFDADHTTIGGDMPGQGNLISGNTNFGILVSSSDLSDPTRGGGTVILGNDVGTNRTGDAAISNSQGIVIWASGIRIGDNHGGGNLISGNGRQITINAGTGNVVQGNTIGLNASRTAAIVPNGPGLPTYSTYGVDLEGTADNLIGGTASGARNVIAGSQFNIYVNQSARNLIQGNLIGTDGSGTVAIAGSQLAGILIADSADNTIGGTVAAARNVISGHSVAGIEFANGGAIRNAIQGNSIGTDVTGELAVPNGDGIADFGGSANTIGGIALGAGNVISGNAGSGIHFVSDVVHSTPVDSMSYVWGNMIGTNPAGTVAIPNAVAGILIEHTYDIFIGGADPGTPGLGRNVISGNLGPGVAVTGYLPASTPFTLFDNFIGTDVTGTADLGNGGAGVLVTDSAGGVIGSRYSPESRNIIAYNGKSTGDGGVFLSNSKGTVVEANTMFLNSGPGISNSALFNTPTIQSVNRAGGTLSVSVTYHTADAGNYWFSIYAVGTADADGGGEGKTYLGGFLKTLPANTDVTVSPDVPFTPLATMPAHLILTATATVTVIDGIASGTTGFGLNLGGDRPPSADAGTDRTGLEGTPISFDGGGSTDPDGDALTYSWVFKNSVGATVGIATGPKPVFVFPSAGNYTATLTVDDGFGGIDTSGPINVLVQNSPPQFLPSVLSLSQQYNLGGGSVASVGGIIAIGQFGATTSGSIYLYNSTTGALLMTLAAPSPAVGDRFGAALAAVGANRLLVGAPGTNGGDGAAYLVDVDPAGATFGAVKTTFASVTGGFGSSVAAVGSLVAIGAPDYGNGAGVVAMFDPVTGTMTNYLADPRGGIGNTSPHFGRSVAALGSRLIVGAPTDNNGGSAAGAVYLFDTATNQTLQTFLNPNPAFSDSPDLFGAAVGGVGTDRVVVGAPSEDSRGANSGAAYFFDVTTGKLSVTASPALTIGAQFGSSIAVNGPTALIGAPGSIVVAGGTRFGAGAAFLIDADSTSPTYGSTLGSVSDPSATTNEHFGTSVAFTTDGRALVGSTSSGVSVYRQNVTLGIFSQAIAEGGETNLSGSFTDPGTGQTHTLTVTWGDGSANSVVNLPAGATVFNAALYPALAHLYPQDASNAFPITVTVSDGAGGTDLATGPLNVRNVAPTFVTPNIDGQMDEGSFYQLSGSVVDPGTLDAHVVTIDWGDQSPVTVLNLAAGQAFPTQSHPYVDNKPGDAPYTIHIVVTDSAGASNSYDLHEVVHNVAPTLRDLALTASSINEGDTVTLTGGWSDPGTLDTHNVTVVWGDGTSETIPTPPDVFGSDVSTFTIAHHYLNNPIGVVDLPLVISVADDDGGVGTTGLAGQPAAPALAIHDVAPKAAVSVDQNASLLDPDALHVVASVIDPGFADVADPSGYAWQVEGIDAGNHSTVLLTFAQSAGMGPNLTFTYPSDAANYLKYAVTLVVTDRDGMTGTDRATVVNLNLNASIRTLTDADFSTGGDAPTRGVVLGTGVGTIDGSAVTIPMVVKVSPGKAGGGLNVTGGSGDDLIIGDGASQVLDGAAGNDTIVSNHGDDTIKTGSGDNTVFFIPGSSPTLIAPHDANNVNTINLSKVPAPDSLGKGVSLDLSIDDGTSQPVDSDHNTVTIDGIFRQVIGTQFDDTLIGNGKDDTLNGGAGSNLLMAGSGNSSIIGGTGGKNTIIAGSGNDVIFGGTGGYDSIIGASGNVTMTGANGNSTIQAGGGNATIQAGGGYNTIVAGAGNNTIYGGSGGHDSIIGGAGNTTVSAGNGNSTMTAGSGNSTIYGGTGGYNTIVAGGGNDVIFGGTGGYSSIVGGQGNTTMTGGSGATTMIGGAGNTSIQAGGGYNTIISGGGNDVIFGGSGGYDSIIGGAGNTTVSAGNGNSTMTGGSGNSTIYGGTGGHNTIISGGGNDVIFGGTGGYSSIVGGQGGTTTTGGNGNTTVSGATGGTTIYGGGYSSVPGSNGGAGVTMSSGGGHNTIISGGGNDVIFGSSGGYDSISGGSSNTTMTGANGATTISGGGGNTTIQAGGGYNTIVAGGGNSVIFGGTGGYDSIIGGAGNSTVSAGNGNSTITGGSGNSTISGGDGGHNTIVAGGGNSVIFGGTGGYDSISGGQGGTTTTGGNGNTTISGTTGGTTIYGGDGGHNTIISGGGNDVIFGGTGGYDSISGGGGNTSIYGGGGNNTIVSGGGNSFIAGGTQGGNSITGGGGNNTILAGGGNDVIFGGNGAGMPSIIGGGGHNTILAGGGNDVIFGGSGGYDSVSGGGGNTSIFGGGGSSTITAGSGNTVIIGGPGGYNSLVGGLGNSTATGATGNSTIYGGTGGFNTILGGSGNDVLFGGAGDDAPGATAGHNRLVSGSGASTLHAANGPGDTLIGVDGSNVLIGGTGNDLLFGGVGTRSISGVDGDDTIVAGGGNTTIDGGNGTNLLVVGFANGANPSREDALLTDTALTLIDPATHETINTYSIAGIQAVILQGNDADNLIDASGFRGNVQLLGLGGDDSLYGGPGDDTLDGGSGNDTLKGGLGRNTYTFQSTSPANETVDNPYDVNNPQILAAHSGLNFLGLGGPVTIDLARSGPQVVSPGLLTITLVNPLGISDVLGSPFDDAILGNARDNVLTGAGGQDLLVGAAGDDRLEGGLTQLVYLDFTSYAAIPGLHAYTQAERNAIQQGLAADFGAFSYVFTQNRPQSGDFSTLTFNDPKLQGLEGGIGDGIDWRNLVLNDNGSINVDRLFAILTQQEANNPAFNAGIDFYRVQFTVTIAAHELAHLAGLKHGDSYGPIGAGIYRNVDPSLYLGDGATVLPQGADETPFHILASGASVQTTLADAAGLTPGNTAGVTFFGEREDVKLAFDDHGQNTVEQGGLHPSLDATAQLTPLNPLTVPNTALIGRNAGLALDVRAANVIGQLGYVDPQDPHTQVSPDVYAFHANAGDLFNAEVLSASLARVADSIDSTLSLYYVDPITNEVKLVPYGGGTAFNDDAFQGTDSILIDVTLPRSVGGVYYLMVDSYNPPGGPHRDAGQYELFFYTFAVGDAVSGGDTLIGGSGADALVGNSSTNLIEYDPGEDVRLFDPSRNNIVANVAPQDLQITVGTPGPHAAGTPVSLSGAFLDYDDADTHTFLWSVYAADDTGFLHPLYTSTEQNTLYTPDAVGSFVAVFAVSDNRGNTASADVPLTVDNAPPVVTAPADQNAVGGTSRSILLGSFSDPDAGGSPWTVTVNWGDGSADSTFSADSFSLGALEHAFERTGTVAVTVTVKDAGGLSGSAGFHVVVAPSLVLTGLYAALPAVRNTGLTYVDVSFTKAIDMATLSTADFGLTRDGSPVPIIGALDVTDQGNNTYRVSGFAPSTAVDGHYILSVYADGIATSDGMAGTGTGSVAFTVDANLVSSRSSVAPTASGLVFPVTITGSDIDPITHVAGSGLDFFDLYQSIDGAPFVVYGTVPAGSPDLNGQYTAIVYVPGASNHSYAFYARAHDLGGNVESKPAVAETSNYVGDFTAPATSVTAVDTSSSAFQVRWAGKDNPGGSGLKTVNLYVQVDSSPVALFASIPITAGTVGGAATYQVNSDGLSHDYRFFSVGIDARDNTEAAPNAVGSDKVVSSYNAGAAPLAYTGLTINSGLATRSYIRTVDVGLSRAITPAELADAHVTLIKHGVDGSGSTPITLSSDQLKIVDQAIEIEFGDAVLNGANAASSDADGIYEIQLDLGDGVQSHEFYRLLGDTDGNYAVDPTDLNTIAAAVSNPYSSPNADIDGNGIVNTRDKSLATRNKKSINPALVRP